MKETLKVIISGGGTGGHIFPAIAIANAIKEIVPEADILFVGAESRMEMERVPAAGYPIIGLPVYGFYRKNMFKNIKVIVQLCKSLLLARKTIKEFKPHLAIGVGGYASGPTLWAAAKGGVPTLIQEQNSYAGITNKLLAKGAKRICVAYPHMERFFPKERIELTGNPVRETLLNSSATREEAVTFFGLDPHKPTILVVGGSLGARSINQSVAQWLDAIAQQEVQFIWQTGKHFDEQAQTLIAERGLKQVKQMPFIAQMEMAYKAADLVISRAGASSISELCLLHKPSILLPSPNVTEDHQTKNAQVLAQQGAALLVRDAEACERLIPTALELVANAESLAKMGVEAGKLALPHSAQRIATLALELAKN